MVLTLITINKLMERQEYSCWVSTLEYALDMTTRIMNEAYLLLKASITEENGTRMVLPVDIFDGDSFSKHIKRLELEWQAVLSQPINYKSLHHQRLIGLARQHIINFQSRMNSLEIAINQTSQQWCHLEQLGKEVSFPSILSNQYLVDLGLYRHQLTCAQLHHEVAIDQLKQLQACP